MIAFLSDNGWTFDATADEAEPMIIQLASGQIEKSAFTIGHVSTCTTCEPGPKHQTADPN
jgi:prophage maintenance system killer protein